MKKFKKLINELDEAKKQFEIHHKNFSDAWREAEKFVQKRGYEINEEEYFNQVAAGPKRPAEGKTNKYKLGLMKGGKPVKNHFLIVQIYGMKNMFELNMYIS